MSLSSKNWFRGLAATSAAIVFAVAGGAAAFADNLATDGDALTAGSQTEMAFGTVQCAVASTKNAIVTVTRQGSATGTNTFASSAAVDVTVTSTSTAVTAAVPAGAAGDVDLTSTWTAATNGTVSEAVTVPVSVLSSTPGAGTATVTFTGRGPNTDGALITRTDSVIVTWTTASCSTPTTTTVTCPLSAQTYTGAAVEPCSATVTGAGFSQPATVTYSNNTNVGTATASASFAGDNTHLASSGSSTFGITRAAATTTVTCPPSVEWTGVAQTPCTATATGAGGLSQSLTPTYADNTAVGTATASAGFGGDANHSGSSDSTTFEITKTGSAVTLTCDAGPFTYNGAAQEPCTAYVTGAGGLDEVVPVTYENNTDAGNATASAMYDGDTNHTGSGDSTQFVIGQASSTVTVTCPEHVTYTGTPLEPCTATATGAGALSVDVTDSITYGTNTNAGNATASATYAGDANHTGSTGTGGFTVDKASSTVTVTCPSGPFYFTGLAVTPGCTANATGAGGLSVSVTPVTFSNNVRVSATATASATYGGDANHLSSTGSTMFTITGWTTGGFYQPVDTGGVWNTVKNGSTVPLKFELFAGTTEMASTSAVAGFDVRVISCTNGALTEDAIELTTTGGTSLRYDTTGGQFVQNWQTPKKPGYCYAVTTTAADGSTISASFRLK